MYRVAEKIHNNAPRLHTRVLKLQKEIMDQIFAAQDAFWNDHLAMAHYLKLRDFTGRSTIHLLLETKVYEIMQISAIEQVIKSLWLGKQNFGGQFMEESTAYQIIFSQGSSSRFDSEAIGRSNTVSFKRKIKVVNANNTHPLSYHGVFSRMYVLY